MSSGQLKIAYLVSQYPATNHTFILREIVGLRVLGMHVEVVAIRADDRQLEQMTAVERVEHLGTRTVFPFGTRFASAHVGTLVRNPLGYARGLRLALGLASWNVRSAAAYVVYFCEAVVAGSYIKAAGIGHAHTHFSSTVTLLMAKIFGFSMSMTVHGPDEFSDVVGFHMRTKVAACRFVVAISDYARSQIMRACPPDLWDRIEVCRLGVDPGQFVPGTARENADPFRLICVGRLAPVKAQRVLIQAVARAIDSGLRVRLCVVGPGPDRQLLEALVGSLGLNGAVEFAGAKNQEELRFLYLASDAFVLASFAEGVPVVLMEAMAMEIPCIATWVNGVPELIQHEVSGLLVAPAREADLAAAIVRLGRDAGLRRALGRAGRLRVEADYDLSTNVALLRDVMARHLAASAPASGPVIAR